VIDKHIVHNEGNVSFADYSYDDEGLGDSYGCSYDGYGDGLGNGDSYGDAFDDGSGEAR
jgi:hypothetical protein